MILRRACPEDVPQLVALVQKTYVEPPYDHYLTALSWFSFMQQHASFVMEDDGKVVAHAGLEDKITFGVFNRTLVDKDYRKQGIYRELYDVRLSEVGDRFRYIESHAATHHPLVQQFLLSKGFEPVGVELLEINDVAGAGQRGSLVRLRLPRMYRKGIVPTEPAPYHEGLVPINYHQGRRLWPAQEGTWQYEEVPQGFDASLIHIDPMIIEKLHLQKLMKA